VGVPQLSIIGLGLIGGSVALAARKANAANIIHCWDENRATLAEALAAKLVDIAADSVADAAADASLIVIAAPVGATPALILEAAQFCRTTCAITDTGSVKGAIHRALKTAVPNFVGSHPLAGSDKSGHRHASANLFEDRTVVLTRGADCGPAAFEQVKGFWERIGARIVEMDAEEHDRIIARTSHLPHFLAAAMTAGVARDPRNLIGKGFRDTTRIAAGDAALWTDIALANREAILTAMNDHEREWQGLQSALQTTDRNWIYDWLKMAKQVRDDLGN
jgi:prephenate dehydrogenase